MQMPVFLILFFAPVYVPLPLLTGWIEAVATLNPFTYVLEASRSMLAGDEIHVASAFVLAGGLVSLLRALVAARPAQGRGRGLVSPGVGYRRAVALATSTQLGAVPLGQETSQFRVWAPNARSVARRRRGARAPRRTASSPARPRWGLAATTASCSTAATRGPTRARAGSPRASAGPRASSTPRRSRSRPGPALALDELVLYELHVGTFSRGGHLRRRRAAARRAARARRDRDRADAGRDLPGRARLGLRRPLHLRAARGLRRAGGARAARRRGAPRGSRRRPRRRLQPRRPRQRGAACVRPLLHRPLRDALGRRDRLRAARACASGRSRTPSSGCATTGSTGSGSTPCTRSTTTRPRTSSPSSPSASARPTRTRS